MSFEKEGFLGQEAEQYKSKIINDNQELFNLCFELNTLAHGSKYDLQIHNQEAQEMILGCLLIRLLNNFQGIAMLSNYGLVIEAKILLRSMLETLFILKICCEDKDFINKYIKSDQVYRYRLLNIPENNPVRNLEKELFSLKPRINSMRCIYCKNDITEVNKSIEHVFPEAFSCPDSWTLALEWLLIILFYSIFRPFF